jgi:hypothetical protein
MICIDFINGIVDNWMFRFRELRGTVVSLYRWQEPYKAALLETDWIKLTERIQVAESAIRERQGVLSHLKTMEVTPRRDKRLPIPLVD